MEPRKPIGKSVPLTQEQIDAYDRALQPPQNNNPIWWMGLAASVMVAAAAEAHALPEPWSKILVFAGIIGTAITGYLIRR